MPGHCPGFGTQAFSLEVCENTGILMYSTVLFLHSWIRWLAVLAGLLATAAAIRKDSIGLTRAQRRGFIFMIALDLQVLLGLLLYGVLSPFTAQAMSDFGAAMRDPVLRYWAVEHFTMMLAAAVLVHVGRVLARKAASAEQKRKRLLICFGLATVLMLAGIPWPGMENARELFRF